MDDTQKVLFDIDSQTIFMSTYSGSETILNFYEALTEIRKEYPSEPIQLFVTGEGGMGDATIAIVDLILNDKNIVGHLIGSAVSCHVFIWAACSKRYVYPYSNLQVHACFDGGQMSLTKMEMKYALRSLDALNKAFLEIMVNASNKDKKWWEKRFYLPGKHAYFMDSEKLVEIGMAELASQRIANFFNIPITLDVKIVENDSQKSQKKSKKKK